LVLEVADQVRENLIYHGGHVTESTSYALWQDRDGWAANVLKDIRRGNLRPDPDVDYRKTVPYDHQINGQSWLETTNRGMLLDKMGLGKTKQTIDTACSLPLGNRVIVVCPNSVKAVWDDEIAKHGWDACGNWVLLPRGKTKERAEHICHFVDAKTTPADNQPLKWIILNYESLRYIKDAFLYACKDAILILDEAHRCKNARAQMSKIVTEAQPARLWLLTGTPVANRPEDLYSLLTLVRPGWWPSWYSFDKRYLVHDHFGAITNYQNLDELKEMLASVSLGRTKEQCLDLPPKVFQVRNVELGKDERKAYERMKKDLVTWLEEEDFFENVPTKAQAATFAVRYLRLRQLTHGLVSEGQDGAMEWSKTQSKIEEVKRIWEDFGNTHMVVWCQFVPVVERIAHEMSCRAYALSGKVPEKKRAEWVKEWSEHGGVLVCQMDAMGEGVNLQAAHLQVFADLPQTPKQREQCADRLHRIGQKDTVVVVDVIATDTVDVQVRKSLKRKIDWAAQTSAAAYGTSPAAWKEMVG
jgi:SNF2 family DNA or RNA helicase